MLKDKNGVPVATGIKICNNLYKMSVTNDTTDTDNLEATTFVATGSKPSWEMWHCRFGHISYDGLCKLLQKNLVEGFEVSKESAPSDCVTCVEAKMTIDSYKTAPKCHRKSGELTHIDLWGKYEVASINGHQYYIVFIDDATRFTTINFLKKKDEASIRVKNYMTHLKSCGRIPLAMRIDQGMEFLNDPLVDWCHEHGIDLEPTAPYSPSQNGVAERMNRTLVELTCAMIRGRCSPEFLWEHAAEHAAYLQNQAYTRSLKGKTPYEAWHGNKPNVGHLWEFGIPVWVLLQGQKEPCKILPKSKSHTFVGFDDGPKAIKYYSAETRKVLIS